MNVLLVSSSMVVLEEEDDILETVGVRGESTEWSINSRMTEARISTGTQSMSDMLPSVDGSCRRNAEDAMIYTLLDLGMRNQIRDLTLGSHSCLFQTPPSFMTGPAT